MKTILEQLDEAEKARRNAIKIWDRVSAETASDKIDNLINDSDIIRALIQVAKAAEGQVAILDPTEVTYELKEALAKLNGGDDE